MGDFIGKFKTVGLVVISLLLGAVVGCSHRPLKVNQDDIVFCKSVPGGDELAARFAPVFKIFESSTPYNLIGRPAIRKESKNGRVQVFINPDEPVIFYEKSHFTTDQGDYCNLVYRVHFEKVPFSLVPFYLTAGRHPGLLVVVTLDEGLVPILLSVVNTCGCYLAMIPTTALPVEAFPVNWKFSRVLNVYGEKLPALLDYDSFIDSQLLVSLRPDVHRVMGLQVISDHELQSLDSAKLILAELEPMAALDDLTSGQESTSFFHEQGFLQDHVKGAAKPWETLLMSWFSLDLWVGMDKRLGCVPGQKNPFYTSLKPWQRRASDMNDFPRFLKYWGWRL